MKEFLILYGADNTMWMCSAEDVEDAVDQFVSEEVVSPHEDESRAAITAVYLCTQVETPN